MGKDQPGRLSHESTPEGKGGLPHLSSTSYLHSMLTVLGISLVVMLVIGKMFSQNFPPIIIKLWWLISILVVLLTQWGFWALFSRGWNEKFPKEEESATQEAPEEPESPPK